MLTRRSQWLRVLFAPDDGSGSGGDGTGAGDGSQDDPPGAPNGDQGGSQNDPPEGGGDEVKFTQADMNDAVQKRLARERANTEAYLKAEAKKAEQSDSERFATEKAELQQAAEAATKQATKAVVNAEAQRSALEQGVDASRVSRFMRLVDLDYEEMASEGQPDAKAIAAAVKAALDESPEFKGAGSKPPAGGGDFSGGNDDPSTFTPEQISAMSVEEFDKHKDAIMAQMQGGAK